MNENPYQAPAVPVRVIGVRSGLREDLRRVATYQKGIIMCILLYILAVIAQLVAIQMALPEILRLLLAIGTLVVGLVATMFVFLLSMKVYNVGLGIFFGVLTVVPCVGLLMLLMINSKATGILRQNGIKVGFFGANLADFEA